MWHPLESESGAYAGEYGANRKEIVFIIKRENGGGGVSLEGN